MTERAYMESQGWVTIPTASKRLGWSYNRFKRAVGNGSIESTKICGTVYLKESSIIEFVGDVLGGLYKQKKESEK